ncbi:MAG TPA: hypothetical protein VGG19_00650 [Tepidisphaeraceae bacterium]
MRLMRKSVLGAGIFLACIIPSAWAVDVVYVPQLPGTSATGKLEAQGFNGRIDLPVNVGTGIGPDNPYSNYTLAGATGNSSTLYTLVNDSSNDPSILLMSDTQTGAFEQAIQLGARFSDVAYTNGQLYGIVQSSNSMQIDSIAANGSVANVVTQAVTSGSWRLSGMVSGDSLLAASPGGSANIGYVIAPATAQVSSINIPSQDGTLVTNTVINSAGTNFTTMGGSYQFISSFPAGVFQTTRASNAAYAPNSNNAGEISDEFSLPYPSSSAALAQIAGAATSPSIVDGLTRSPQVLTLSTNITLSNGLAPDATTLSNVAASNFNPTLSGPSGSPTPAYQQTFSAPTGFASGATLGQLTASVNLAGAPRGTYTISSQPTLTADYSYASTVDTGRAVQTQSSTVATFAYDPPSANLVGNGDATLASAGWESQFANLGWENDSAPIDQIDHGFVFLPLTGDPYAIRQFLQMPTPDSAMMLEFSDHSIFSGSGTLQVTLNGVVIANITVNSQTSTEQQFLISNPALENLTDAPLMFSATVNSGPLQIEVDDITLTAVPEPAAMAVGLLAWGWAMRRWRRT